jgi:adenylate cyclase
LVVASVFFISLLLLITGGIFIARKITRPVTVLTHGAKEIEQGHYDFTIDVNQEDELGKLAEGFNAMSKGLADRAKVRNLLGKVVSPAIAEELLNKGVELGGEERQATIVFCDIRNFTSLCENHEAKQVLTLLNDLLTRLSGVIDQHQGVIDKYIGDAMMALFGVTIVDKQQAQHAVLAALAMQKEVRHINNELVNKQGIAEISLGIGVNSASVIAGNMGSQTRLNYSVIGDGVNISSRLESLTKFYGTPILVGDMTRKLCPDIAFREIDTVRVKGKTKGLTIYQAIAEKKDISAVEINQTQLFEQALVLYKKQQWHDALIILNELSVKNPKTKYYEIYILRIHKLKESNPCTEWEPIFTHQEK